MCCAIFIWPRPVTILITLEPLVAVAIAEDVYVFDENGENCPGHNVPSYIPDMSPVIKYSESEVYEGKILICGGFLSANNAIVYGKGRVII